MARAMKILEFIFYEYQTMEAIMERLAKLEAEIGTSFKTLFHKEA